MSRIFLFAWNSNLSIANKCEGLISSQKVSFISDNGTIFSPSAIKINLFSSDVLTKTV